MDNFVKSGPSFFESMATIKVYRWQVLFFLKYPIYLCIAQLAFDHRHPLPLCQTGTLETFLALFYRFNMKKVALNRLGKRAMPKYKNIRKGLPLFCFPIIDSIKQINLQRFSVVKGTMTQTFFNALHLTPSNRTKYLWNRGTKFGTLQSYKITFRNVLLFALMIYNRKSNGGTFATEMSTSMLLTKLCWGLNNSLYVALLCIFQRQYS